MRTLTLRRRGGGQLGKAQQELRPPAGLPSRDGPEGGSLDPSPASPSGARAPSGALFVVIDRAESDKILTLSIKKAFEEELNVQPALEMVEGRLDDNEQAIELGDELRDALLQPRITFTSFRLVAKKK
jgi:hypothetical protein